MDHLNLQIELDGKFHTYPSFQHSLHTLTQQQDLTIININIRSLRKHWDTLLSRLTPIIHNVDIIVLTEINISTDETNNYNIQGFNAEFKCRLTGNGGGILILYRETLATKTLNLELHSAELLAINFMNKNKNFILLAIYRPPDQNVNTFNEELNYLLNTNQLKLAQNIVMTGDINICYLKKTYGWSDYVDTLFMNGFTNTTQSYTREEIVAGTLVQSCIDHINLKLSNYTYTSFVIQSKIADHYFTGCKINFSQQQTTTKNSKNTFKIVLSNNKVNENIKKENWWPLLDITDPEEIYNTLVEKFNKIYEKSKIKIKTKNQNIYNPWFNKNLKKLIEQKDNLWHKLKNDPMNTQLNKDFKKIRNKVTSEIRRAKQNYYFKKFSKSARDSKQTWKIINELINKKPKPTVKETLQQNFKLNNQKELQNLSEQFNDSFRSAVHKIHQELKGEKFKIKNQIKTGNHSIGKHISMNFKKMKEHTLSKIVNKLNTNSSAGPDNIRPQDIKNNYNHLKLVLIHLINKIRETGTVPIKMKITHLRPIFKNGTKNSTDNYRPIGSISIIMKILEHHICEQLKKYLTKNNIINQAQHGFMPKKSTIGLLEHLTTDINTALNKNMYMLAVSLDLSKAFDIISHEILLNKLEKIGIRGNLLNLLTNYFQDRTTRVSIGDILSSPTEQLFGLIQGSILSPILFNIYVNDLASLDLRCKILCYADDTLLYLESRSLKAAFKDMQNDLNLIVKYFFNNSIKQNTTKTKVILFKNPKTTQQKIPQLYCHTHICFQHPQQCQCHKLPLQNNLKHLGIFLDSNMDYSTHVTKLCNTLRKVLFQMYRIRNYIPVKTKRVIHFSLTESIIRYGITIYTAAPNHILKPLKKLTERITKALFNNISPNLVGILTFENLTKYVLLTNKYFDQQYRIKYETNYNLRHSEFQPVKYNNSYGKALFQYQIPTLLNQLPPDLVNIEMPFQMKIKLRTFFLNSN